MIQHTTYVNRKKRENHVIISVDEETAFNKIQQYKLGTEWKFLNLEKGISAKHS